MFAKGNCGHYEHSALDWLAAGQVKLPNGGSLVWYKIQDIGATEVFEFVYTDQALSMKAPCTSSLNDIFARRDEMVL